MAACCTLPAGAVVRAGRCGALAYSLVAVALVSGVVYGWPSLRLMLVREGVLSGRCGEATAPGGGTCSAQDLALGTAFTVGAWTVQGGRFLGGLLRDAAGTRVAAAAAAAAAAAGFLVLALAGPEDVAAVSGGFGLVGMGSSLQLAVQPVATLFPHNSALVTACLSLAFQASGGVLLLLGTIADGRESAGMRRELLGVSAAVAAAVALAAVLLLPAGKSFDEVVRRDVPAGEELVCPVDDRPAEGARPAPKTPDTTAGRALAPPSPPPLAKLSFRGQLLSFHYAALTLWFCAVVVVIQFYVISIGPQLERVFDAPAGNNIDADGGDGADSDMTGERMTRTYNLVYFAVSPTAAASGYFCDRIGFGPVLFANTALVAVCFLCLGSSSVAVQTIGFVVYCTGRLSIYATFFARLNSIVGFAYFGTLAGLALLLSSLVALTIYPLLDWGLAHGFEQPNVLMGTIATLALVYSAQVLKSEHRGRKARMDSASGDACSDEDGICSTGGDGEPLASRL